MKLLIVIRAFLYKGSSEVCGDQPALRDVGGKDTVSLQKTNYIIIKLITVSCWKDQYSEPDAFSQEINGIQGLYSFLWELSRSLAKTVNGIKCYFKKPSYCACIGTHVKYSMKFGEKVSF